jgi:hypothetical protein
MVIPYVKNVWIDGSGGGTPVSAARLGVIETGIYAAHRMPTCRVYNSAAISLTTGVPTVVTFNSERWDTDTIHSTSSNTGRLTCSTAGVYQIFATVEFAANATGQRSLALRRTGGVTVGYTVVDAAAAGVTALTISVQDILAVNDYVELLATQTSGGNLNVDSATSWSPEFGMTRIST